MSHGSGSGECILDNRNRREEGGQIRPARTERAKEIYGTESPLYGCGKYYSRLVVRCFRVYLAIAMEYKYFYFHFSVVVFLIIDLILNVNIFLMNLCSFSTYHR